MKIIKHLRFFFSLLGSRNWYEGVDNPSLKQRIYTFRIGFKTAWEVSRIIHLNKN